jgi:hypothetical protein
MILVFERFVKEEPCESMAFLVNNCSHLYNGDILNLLYAQ